MVPRTKVRVGVVVPGRVTATWPLAGLRFDDDGLALAVPALVRRAMGPLLQGPCDWREVESVQRDRFSVAVRLHGRPVVRLTAFFGKRARDFVEAGRSHGVLVDA